MRRTLIAFAIITAAGLGSHASATAPQVAPDVPASFGCAPLPAPAGPTVTVGPAQAARLPEIVGTASPGTTILLRDGTYALNGAGLWFRQPGVTLRSASNNATAVVIDGGYRTNEVVAISASEVTIAHVTITRAVDHLVHAYPINANSVRGMRLFGLRLIDGGEQFVKANPNNARTAFVDEGRVECSFFRLTDEGRSHVETQGGASCYTGGIDVHAGRGWVVRLSRFEDLYCQTGRLAEHAVHFWTGSSETLVENNTILNCARGIGFGLGPVGASRRDPSDPEQPTGYVGHRGGLIRNNVIYADVREYDTGIGLEQAWGARVFHNTVFATAHATGAFSAIDVRFGNTRAEVRNNLVTNITVRQGGNLTASHNLEGVPATAFVNAGSLDFHIRADYAAAIDQGTPVPDAGVDIDGEVRGASPDIGADERRGPGLQATWWRTSLLVVGSVSHEDNDRTACLGPWPEVSRRVKTWWRSPSSASWTQRRSASSNTP